MRTVRVRVIVGVAVLVACAFAQVRPRRMATLRLRVTDSHGNPVQDWEVTRLVDVAGRDWKNSVSAAGVAQIPPGEYSLDVDQHSFLPFAGTISVREPTTYFTAGLLWGGIEDTAGADDVFGRFETPPGEDSWCKLSGLYTGHGHFALVGTDGKFRFVLVPSETYALVCWRGSTMLTTRIVDAAAGSNPEIVVEAGKSSSPK